jgi:hypothetical protein
MISVDDKIVTTTQTITSVEIEVVSLVLGKSAKFMARQFNAEKNLVDLTFVDMEGDDYTAWDSDDNYVQNFVLSALGLVKKDE